VKKGDLVVCGDRAGEDLLRRDSLAVALGVGLPVFHDDESLQGESTKQATALGEGVVEGAGRGDASLGTPAPGTNSEGQLGSKGDVSHLNEGVQGVLVTEDDDHVGELETGLGAVTNTNTADGARGRPGAILKARDDETGSEPARPDVASLDGGEEDQALAAGEDGVGKHGLLLGVGEEVGQDDGGALTALGELEGEGVSDKLAHDVEVERVDVKEAWFWLVCLFVCFLLVRRERY